MANKVSMTTSTASLMKYATTDGSYEYNMLWDYKNGNLKKRWDQYGNKDTMAYDNLDRLVRWTTQSSDMSIHHDTVHYADNGNILKKTDVGSYTYDPVRIYATTEITNPHGLIKDAQQYITYNSFCNLIPSAKGLIPSSTPMAMMAIGSSRCSDIIMS
ncbi:MAG: hypothetical protein IPN46_18210 [Saprospiraceae bacterium]|nr:hypothetical protein [Saprospiraceae bacterium]